MRVPLYFIFFLVLSSCKSEDQEKSYLFLGHTYQWGVKDNNRIDYRLKDFDFQPYDQIWLGGDLCARSNESPKTLAYLDSIFDLSAETTHWALGNHDIKHGTLQSIEHFTQRKSFYTTSFDDLTLAVLNTNEFHYPAYFPNERECEIIEGQLSMLKNIADTIQQSSHLVVLHHLVMLKNYQTKNLDSLNKIWNLYLPELMVDCENKLAVETGIYPILKDVQAKGIQVVLIGGDLGQRSKKFEYQSEDGIWFLGSGINNSAIDHYLPDYVTNTNPDSILMLDRNLKERNLSWRFEPLEKFILKE